MRDSKRDFLSRWSSRKQKARERPEPDLATNSDEAEFSEAVAPEPGALSEAAEAASEVPAQPEKTDAEILQELGLPDPDSLLKGDSIAGFLRAGVPVRLRNRALKRLWLTDPVFANLDGLNDYEEDYTDAATVVKGMRTAYRPGRGFLRDDPAPKIAEAVEPVDSTAGPSRAEEAAEDIATADAPSADMQAYESTGEQADGADPAAPSDAEAEAGGEQDNESSRFSDLAMQDQDAAAPSDPHHALTAGQADDEGSSAKEGPDETEPEVVEVLSFPRRMQFRFDE